MTGMSSAAVLVVAARMSSTAVADLMTLEEIFFSLTIVRVVVDSKIPDSSTGG